ncbi:DUF4112 domain-containing protein [Halioxenophilus aromaticivorans]|uniref:DUF4112 domain-containing protein n=1 Tax=Halioxenophilus aromaticivorans TaxID=1306992 RepID=A0AAV3U2J8_9ALTE
MEAVDNQQSTEKAKQVEQLDKLAWLLDESVRLPGGFRVGVESIIGLIPGAGDALGFLLSMALVVKARRAGASRGLQARMVANSAFESAVGVVPIVGDLFDFWFKANKRNIKLLRNHLAKQDQSHDQI